ncbi:MAG: PhoH family protein [Deltaproteobacteria bacterium]|nr:MAG: PhoH family protein [Deltaproteobacteria bacterium]
MEVEFGATGILHAVCGPSDSYLRLLERHLGVKLNHGKAGISIAGPGEKARAAWRLIGQLAELVSKGRQLHASDIEQAARLVKAAPDVDIRDIYLDTVLVSSRRRQVTPLGPGQKRYIEAMRRHDVVFAIGPAGTGKTYLAMAMAVAELQKQNVRRIIITRPAVEAGEKLGFLPGDLVEKVNPYLRPLYDALHDMLDPAQVGRLVDKGTLEVAPLAFMRGRTLNDSFIILDEAQNTTSEQMKMFLTRLGYDSRAVITGDITQVDLHPSQQSGLVEAARILKGIPGIAFCFFDENDVVRHPLVSEVIKAYQRYEQERKGRNGNDGTDA